MNLKQAVSGSVKADAESVKLVEKYVQRELVRPKTTWVVPALIALLAVILPHGVGYALLRIFQDLQPVWCYLVCYLVIDLIMLRILLIKLVMCYQHYAREMLRRFCMCKPSCSEYAIAALKKYPLVWAITKIIYRLTVTCDGEMKINLP